MIKAQEKNIKQKEGFVMKGHYKLTFENIKTGEKRIVEKDNLIVTAGRAWIASRLAVSGSPADIRITHSALGTGTSTPANADTQLQTEVYRKNVASATSDQATTYLTAFYSATEYTGNIKEAGMFINGSAGANTGTLFSRIALDTTKSSVETLTIDYTISLQ